MEWIRTNKRRQSWILFNEDDIVGDVVGVTLNGKTTWHASAWVHANADGIDTDLGEFDSKKKAFNAVYEYCLTKN